jgi:hypothetical protein
MGMIELKWNLMYHDLFNKINYFYKSLLINNIFSIWIEIFFSVLKIDIKR